MYCTAHPQLNHYEHYHFSETGFSFASVHVTANVFFDAHQQLQGYLRIELYSVSEKYDRV